ncbi:MAG: FtsX-like permease family protein [Candidatus Cryptobacteroides sp.]|nr:FtsX-like permease family protein [Candidatus Cryptobacteroides sp.]
MKYFFRFLKNNPLYAVINVVGLALSLMFVILIGDYTYRQFSIDKWHRNHERIYVLGTENGNSLLSWPDCAHSLKDRYPEVEDVCCVYMHNGKIKHEDRVYEEAQGDNAGNIMLADSNFFRFFDFKMIDGDRETALDSPEKCVVTESLAKALFPDGNALGQPLQIEGTRYVFVSDDNGDPYDSSLVYTVSGVIKDLDKTVFLNETAVIANFERAPQVLGYRLRNDLMASGPLGSTLSFLMLRPGASLEDKIEDLTSYCIESIPVFNFYGNTKAAIIPLDDLMFAPQNTGAGLQTGDKSLLGILLAVVLAILMFAVTNYINLTVANTGFRAKEMATRRLLGSDGLGISLELIGESTLMVFISFIIGGALALLLEDKMAVLFKGKIDILKDINLATVSVSLLFIVLTGVISGIMPTVSLSRYKPIDVVKGSFRYHSKMVLSRIFIILQNVITMTMMAATLTILLQMSHLVKAPLGYNTENIFRVSSDNPEVMRNALKSQPFVQEIGSFSGTSLDGNYCSMSTRKDKDNNNLLVYLTTWDKEFIDIMGINLVKDNHLSGDVKYINEELAGKLSLGDGESEVTWGDGKVLQVAGIFSNFHMTNILDPYQPFLISVKDTDEIEDPNFMVKTDGSPDARKKLCDLIKEVDGTTEDLDWKVQSIESTVKASLTEEKNTMRIVSIFTGVAVLISILGFIGMSLFFIRQRKKEIGVRRIMGSTTNEVLSLLLTKFCAPLLVSFIFAVPLSWFVMGKWLEGFSYRIGLSPWIFIASGAVSLLIAVVSIFFQTLHAAHSNPADAIRAE